MKKSGSFQQELRLALNVMAEMLEEEIYLIPLKLDECEVPDLQQAEYGVKLRDIQQVDYWQDDGWNRLLQAIAQLQKTNPSTEISPSLPTFSNLSLKLNYSSRSLLSLRIKFYDLLIRMQEQTLQSITITAKEIEDWLKEIELAEKQIQEIRENFDKRED